MQVSVIKQPTKSRERTFDLNLEGLSQNEANFLFTVIGGVAGNPDTSGSGLAHEIHRALYNKGAVHDPSLIRDPLYIFAQPYPKTPATTPLT